MRKLAEDHGSAVILAAFQKDHSQSQTQATSTSSQSPSGRSLTAATLIDAIIIHSINNTPPENGPNGSGATSTMTGGDRGSGSGGERGMAGSGSGGGGGGMSGSGAKSVGSSSPSPRAAMDPNKTPTRPPGWLVGCCCHPGAL